MATLLTMITYLACGVVIGSIFARGFRVSHVIACIVSFAVLFGLHVVGSVATGSGYLAFSAVGPILGVFGVVALFAIAPLITRKGGWVLMIVAGIACAGVGLMTMSISEGELGRWPAVIDLSSQTIKKIWTQPYHPIGLIFYTTPILLGLFYYFTLSKLGFSKDNAD